MLCPETFEDFLASASKQRSGGWLLKLELEEPRSHSPTAPLFAEVMSSGTESCSWVDVASPEQGGNERSTEPPMPLVTMDELPAVALPRCVMDATDMTAQRLHATEMTFTASPPQVASKPQAQEFPPLRAFV